MTLSFHDSNSLGPMIHGLKHLRRGSSFEDISPRFLIIILTIVTQHCRGPRVTDLYESS